MTLCLIQPRGIFCPKASEQTCLLGFRGEVGALSLTEFENDRSLGGTDQLGGVGRDKNLLPTLRRNLGKSITKKTA